jgi:hypothetical protein
MDRNPWWNAEWNEQTTVCDGCGNPRLAHDRAVHTLDESAYCPPCYPRNEQSRFADIAGQQPGRTGGRDNPELFSEDLW